VAVEVNLLKKVRLEIGVNEEFVQPALEAIKKGAQTGNEGDGVVFVLEVAQAMRIRTEETDQSAMG
jgi:nitrogen regulatory protein P-II 1